MRRRKPVRWSDIFLVIAAFALMGAGVCISRPDVPVGMTGAIYLAAQLAVVLSQHVVVYGLNHIIDGDELRRAQGDRPKSMLRSWICLGVFSVPLVAGLAILSPVNRWASLAILGVGALYSLGFRAKSDNKLFRLKSLFIGKNLSIGVGRALLVLVGAGQVRGELLLVAAFVAIQVFVGSALRDFPDVAEDQLTGVRTFPLVFGRIGARRLLCAINAASAIPLAVLAVVYHAPLLALLLTAPVAWRGVTLLVVHQPDLSRMALQVANCMTYVLVFGACLAATTPRRSHDAPEPSRELRDVRAGGQRPEVEPAVRVDEQHAASVEHAGLGVGDHRRERFARVGPFQRKLSALR